MSGANDSYTIRILEELLEGKTLTADGDKYGNNSNQYFATHIKKRGVKLIEWWVPNRTNKGRHLERKLLQTPENIKAALALLARLQSKPKAA